MFKFKHRKKKKISFPFKAYLFIILILTLSCINFKLNKDSREYSNLIRWIKNNGGYISDKVRVIENSEENRYMMSTENINKNELISFIPEKVILSSIHPLLNSICSRGYGLYHEQYFECLVLFLTLDINNTNSFFRPFYDYLPKLDIKIFPIEYSKEEQKLYQDIDIGTYTGMSEHLFSRGYNEDVEKILKEKKILNPKENYRKNFYIVQTRNFSRPGSEMFNQLNSLCPFLDLFNHINDFNLDYYYDEQKKGFLLLSIRDIKHNEELTVSYGKKDNMKLLNLYGFILKNNKYKSPIIIRIDNDPFTLYPGKENEIIKDIQKTLNILKIRNKNHKDMEIYNKKLFITGLKEKYQKLSKIKTNKNNLLTIIEEKKESINNYLKILENNTNLN